MHPALTDSFTGTAHVMSCANKVLEGVLEVAVKIAPVSGIQKQT